MALSAVMRGNAGSAGGTARAAAGAWTPRRSDHCPRPDRHLVIGHNVAASSTPAAMLNHLSRTGSDKRSRRAVLKPAQAVTLGRLTSAKPAAMRATDGKVLGVEGPGA